MVEEYPIARKDPVGLTVIDRVPMGGALGRGVGGPGMERRRLGLRGRRGPEHLRGSGLVVPDVGPAGGGDVGAHGFEEAEGAGGHDVGGVVRDLERDGDVRLGGEVVDLVGRDGVEPAAERGGVGEVGVVELHSGLVSVVGVDVDVVDPLRIEVGGPPDQPVDLVALVEQELRQVRPVLTGYAGDQRDLAVLLGGRGCLAVADGSGSGSGGAGGVGVVRGRHCRRASWESAGKEDRVEMEERARL